MSRDVTAAAWRVWVRGYLAAVELLVDGLLLHCLRQLAWGQLIPRHLVRDLNGSAALSEQPKVCSAREAAWFLQMGQGAVHSCVASRTRTVACDTKASGPDTTDNIHIANIIQWGWEGC